MDRTERFYKIDQLLKDSKVVPFARLKDALGVSRATLKRDLVYMRDRFHAPIEYVRAGNGYRFGKPRAGPRYELPGLWFNATEIYALLTTLQLLSNLQPGLLDGQVPALVERLHECRSEEHTSELQSQSNLVCRLLLEKKKNKASLNSGDWVEHETILARALRRERQSRDSPAKVPFLAAYAQSHAAVTTRQIQSSANRR